MVIDSRAGQNIIVFIETLQLVYPEIITVILLMIMMPTHKSDSILSVPRKSFVVFHIRKVKSKSLRQQ